MGVMTSPIHGADGNIEFLVHLVRGPAHGARTVDEALTGLPEAAPAADA
jgi:hypothetical protein